MKKVITLAATLLALSATAALAAPGLNLSWDDCTSVAGTPDKVWACGANSTPVTMIASIVIPSALPTFASATAVVDIHVDNATLPNWWLTDTGQCRANALTMSFDPANNVSSCTDLWGGSTNLQVTAVQQNLHGANSVRMNGVAAIPAGSEIAVPADGSDLWVCRVQLTRTNTAGCTGCTLGACVVLNQVDLLDPNNPKIEVTNESTRRYVTWQGGGTTNCPLNTPTLNRTWGAVKGLYR